MVLVDKKRKPRVCLLKVFGLQLNLKSVIDYFCCAMAGLEYCRLYEIVDIAGMACTLSYQMSRKVWNQFYRLLLLANKDVATLWLVFLTFLVLEFDLESVLTGECLSLSFLLFLTFSCNFQSLVACIYADSSKELAKILTSISVSGNYVSHCN